jgi:hypothetical protein
LQTGRCFQHALACGGGTAPFLLLRNTRVLALHGSRAALLPSPYVDAHGEEDIGLRRGRCAAWLLCVDFGLIRENSGRATSMRARVTGC